MFSVVRESCTTRDQAIIHKAVALHRAANFPRFCNKFPENKSICPCPDESLQIFLIIETLSLIHKNLILNMSMFVVQNLTDCKMQI